MDTQSQDKTPNKVIILNADKFTSNGKKFGRPKNKELSKPTTKPIRVPLEHLDKISELDDFVSLLNDYKNRCDDSPRWYWFKSFLEELPESFN